MAELPEFWRTEIWHPLSIHFPLAVLLLATLFYSGGFLFGKTFWEKTGKVLLVIGTVGAWLAIYTGNLADPVVSREICDPTVLRTHEANAYMVGWSFSVASVLAAIEYFWVLTKLKKMLKLFVVAITIFGSGFLIYTGHLGATLVYQQGAGVYAPSEDCSEFSE